MGLRLRGICALGALLGLALVTGASAPATAASAGDDHLTGTVGAVTIRTTTGETTAYTLATLEGPRVMLQRDGQPAGDASAFLGHEVTVTGTHAGPAFEVATIAATPSPRGAEPEPPVAAMTGGRPTQVALARFADANDHAQYPPPFTTAQANALVFTNSDSTSEFIEAESGGVAWLAGSSFDWTIPQYWQDPWGNLIELRPWIGCDPLNDNMFYYASSFWPLDTSSHIMIVMPELPGCTWAGIADHPGNMSFYNGTLSRHVTTHEIGHNLGFDHARALDCNAPSFLGPLCTPIEYGDVFDTMGSASTCSYGVWMRGMQSWPTSGSYYQSQSAAPRTLTLRAADRGDDPNGAIHQGLRIDGGPGPWGQHITFEWQAGSPGCNLPAGSPQGVIVRQGINDSNPVGATRGSYLIDMKPATASFADARLQVGEVFASPYANVRVRVDALDATTGYATVTAGAFGFAEVVGNEVRFTARPGDANNLLVETTDGGATWFITDRNNHPVKGFSSSNCFFVANNKVRCNAPTGSKAVVDVADGNDTVEMAANAPAAVYGGTGNDTFPQRATPNGGATYIGGAGTDTLTYAERTQHVEIWQDGTANDGYRATAHGPVLEGDNVGDDVENLIGGSAFDFIVGGAVANFILGNAGQDPTYGGDHLYGQGGNDLILGGAGGDYLNGGDGDDVLLGEADWDTLDGGPGNDTLDSGASGGRIFGGDGNDTMVSGPFADEIDGQAGTDIVDYRARAGQVFVNPDGIANDGEPGEGDNIVNAETVYGGSGNDVLVAPASGGMLIGFDGNDVLWGSHANDVLIGGRGNDTTLGWNGNDLLTDSLFGSPADGSDSMSGGNHNDTVWAQDGTADSIDCGAGTDSVLYDVGLEVPVNCSP